MIEQGRKLEFRSALAPLMDRFLQEKRACGYRYARGSLYLQSLDRFLTGAGVASVKLPRTVVDRWTAKQPHEKPTTQATRVSYTRQFAEFLVRHGHEAFIPHYRGAAIFKCDFAPHIFTTCEIRGLFEAADRLRPDRNSRLRHIMLPLIFRALYGCGMRGGEVVKLVVGDVDLGEAMFAVRGGKFRKDRLVPIAPSLLARLRDYASKMGDRSAQAIFFPAPHGGRYHISTVYGAFRQLLRMAKIPHGGRGRGPRLHDLRHTFAVHRLVRWYREGVDLNAKLPVLAVYMGHVGMEGTQRYLRLIADLFPDVAARQEAAFGQVIPRRTEA
jgi:integrase